MQTAFTLTRRHGSKRWEVSLGPDAAMRDHRAFLRLRRRAGKDPEFAEVAMVQVQRVIRVDKCDKPAPEKPPEIKATKAIVPPVVNKKGPSSLFGNRVAKKAT